MDTEGLWQLSVRLPARSTPCMVRTSTTWGTARDSISVPSSGAINSGSLDRGTPGSVIPPPTANATQWQQNISRDAKQCTAEQQGESPYISWQSWGWGQPLKAATQDGHKDGQIFTLGSISWPGKPNNIPKQGIILPMIGKVSSFFVP